MAVDHPGGLPSGPTPRVSDRQLPSCPRSSRRRLRASRPEAPNWARSPRPPPRAAVKSPPSTPRWPASEAGARGCRDGNTIQESSIGGGGCTCGPPRTRKILRAAKGRAAPPLLRSRPQPAAAAFGIFDVCVALWNPRQPGVGHPWIETPKRQARQARRAPERDQSHCGGPDRGRRTIWGVTWAAPAPRLEGRATTEK